MRRGCFNNPYKRGFPSASTLGRIYHPRLYSVAPSGLEGGSAAMAQRTRETHGTRHTRFTRNKRYEQASYYKRSLFIAEEYLRTCQKGGEGRREDCPSGRLPIMN